MFEENKLDQARLGAHSPPQAPQHHGQGSSFSQRIPTNLAATWDGIHPESTDTQHGSLNVPIEHHPTMNGIWSTRWLLFQVMSNIPKMGQLPTPAQEKQHGESPTVVATASGQWHPRNACWVQTFSISVGYRTCRHQFKLNHLSHLNALTWSNDPYPNKWQYYITWQRVFQPSHAPGLKPRKCWSASLGQRVERASCKGIHIDSNGSVLIHIDA